MYLYYPSCNFTKESPVSAKKIQNYLKEKHDILNVGCCRIDYQKMTDEYIAITVCQACNSVLDSNVSEIKRISMWEFIDNDSNFNFPNYNGKKMVLQDCYRDVNNTKAFIAVRNILEKMNIEIIELANNKEKADFCGLLHFTPRKKENVELLKKHPNIKLTRLPDDIKQELMKEQVESYSNNLVVCYCNSCLRGIKLGGGNGVHLLDLITRDM